MLKFFPKHELVRARSKISPHAKNQPSLPVLPVSSINSAHINIYTGAAHPFEKWYGGILKMSYAWNP